jgi:rod shape determining protein RodA
MFDSKVWKRFDGILFVSTIIIFVIGLAFLYSATYQFTHKQSKIIQDTFLIRQTIWFLLAILICTIVIKVDYQKWLELAYPLYGINLALLAFVLVFGEARLGAQRWISVGNLAFQPSEFSKLVIILTLARYLGQKKATFSQKELIISFCLVGLPFILIVKQPDLGTALTLIPLLFGILYICGIRLRTLAFIFLACGLSSPFLWQMLKDYQKKRIMVFINPNTDPLGAGYTIIQSKIAIGSGKLWGKGWLSGTQNQLNFLPERHTDFIFSVVGEEWGFVGSVLLLALYLLLIWRAFSIAQDTVSFSGQLLVCGIIVMLAFQIVVNIAMTMGFVPVVGLPLPLISYGGSSLFTSLISIALILNIGLRR